MKNPNVASQKFASQNQAEYILHLAQRFTCFSSSLREWTEFDPNKFYQTYENMTLATHECMLFILNVWDPVIARKNDWNFNLFYFIGAADSKNKSIVFEWINDPVWP